MHFLTWSHFKRDNKQLLRHLGVEEGQPIDLRFADGFFICPDDNVNRHFNYPKILLKKSVIELFREKFPDIYAMVEQFYEIVGGFDRLDYLKFKMGANVAYLFAAAYYAHKNKLTGITVSELYRKAHQGPVLKSQKTYLREFAGLAAQRGCTMDIYSLYQFAIVLLKQTNPSISYPEEFSRLNSFARSGLSPYSLLVGEAFEEYMQQEFEKMERKETSSLTKLISSYLQTSGVLIPLDEEKAFQKLAGKHAKNIGLPDYIFVTRLAIIPLDLKLSLFYAKPRQVSSDNLRNLFAAMEGWIRIIFNGITIEGRFIEEPEGELKDLQAERKVNNPMDVLRKKGVQGDDLGRIGRLWRERKPINQELLQKAGVTHSNLGMIVKVFNEMLANKK